MYKIKESEILLEQLCELLEWQETPTPTGKCWCRDDQVIHSEEELCIQIFDEIRKTRKEVILLKR